MTKRSRQDKNKVACFFGEGVSCEVVYKACVSAVAADDKYLFEAVAVDLLTASLENFMNERLGENDGAG